MPRVLFSRVVEPAGSQQSIHNELYVDEHRIAAFMTIAVDGIASTETSLLLSTYKF
jgi:hypothetical protein